MDCKFGKCCLERHRVEPIDSRAVSLSPEEEEDKDPFVKGKRECTDLCSLIVMTIFFITLILLLSYCISKGDIYRIINGYDNCGNVCGKITVSKFNNSEESCNGADHTNKSLLLIKGFEKIIFKPSSVERVCVNTCKDYVDYRKFLNRCIPKKSIEKIGSFFSRSGIVDFFQEVSEDLDLCSLELFYSGLIALGLSAMILFLLYYIAGLVVYLIIFAVASTSLSASIILWTMWKNNNKLQEYHQTINVTTEEVKSTGKSELGTRSSYLVYAIVSTLITIIIFLVLFGMRKRIKLVIIIIKEAGAAIYSMPLLLIQPLISYCLIAMIFTLWLYFTLWIESAGTLSKVSNNNYRFLKDDKIKVTRWYNLLGVYWIIQFVLGCQNMVIAGASSIWYFTVNKSHLNSPIKTSVWRLVRYHLGSVALGSFTVAAVMFARLIAWQMKYWKEKCGIKDMKEKDGCLPFNTDKSNCCCFSIGCCVYKCVLFLSRNAYIQVAMKGCSFCSGGKLAVKVLGANALRLIAINSVGDWVLLLAKLFVVIGTLLFGVLITQIKDGIQHAWVILFIIGICTYSIAHCFMSVYEMVIDCIFMCFCEEMDSSNGQKETNHISPELLNFMTENYSVEERY